MSGMDSANQPYGDLEALPKRDRPPLTLSGSQVPLKRRGATTTPAFWIGKRIIDIVLSTALLLPLGIVGCILVVANPWRNPGPLFFFQVRMGRSRRAITVIKFRTMLATECIRSADDPLERDRITPLGRFLRRARIDELPQILNVLRGDMSLIGPRPDVFHHAKVYCRKIPDYQERFSVRPGISGLAQVEHGYAEGIESTIEKARLDAVYVQSACLRMDTYIFFQTLKTVFTALGK